MSPKPVSGGAGSAKDKRRVGGGGGGGNPPPPSPTRAIRTLSADVDESDRITTLSPEQQKRAALQAKVHPTVLAVIDRLKVKNPVAGADESKFIRGGKAELQIWLTDKSDEAIAKLKALGFEVVLDPKTAKLVIGRLPMEKLPALAELDFVRFIAPQTSTN